MVCNSPGGNNEPILFWQNHSPYRTMDTYTEGITRFFGVVEQLGGLKNANSIIWSDKFPFYKIINKITNSISWTEYVICFICMIIDNIVL